MQPKQVSRRQCITTVSMACVLDEASAAAYVWVPSQGRMVRDGELGLVLACTRRKPGCSKFQQNTGVLVCVCMCVCSHLHAHACKLTITHTYMHATGFPPQPRTASKTTGGALDTQARKRLGFGRSGQEPPPLHNYSLDLAVPRPDRIILQLLVRCLRH